MGSGEISTWNLFCFYSALSFGYLRPSLISFIYLWVVSGCSCSDHVLFFDRHFTYPDLPRVNFPEGFQGNAIPIDGELVARLCHERLSLPE